MAEKTKMLGKTDVFVTERQTFLDLCEYVCHRFGKDMIFLVDRNSNYEAFLKEYYPEILVKQIDSINGIENQSFLNLVLMEVLENYEEAIAKEILNRSWQLLRRKGRLVVIVPNEDVYKHQYQIRKFSCNQIMKMLQDFGHAKLLKEQPYKWLALYVQKVPDESARKLGMEKRFNITARLSKGKVVEFGCGRGLLTKHIHDLGLEVIGVDKNQKKINEAKRNYPEIKFIPADVLELKLEYNSFDTIILPEILEHISEAVGSKMLDVAWNILRPNGRLIVSVPNENCIPSRNHIRIFNRASLNAILSKFGKPILVNEQPFKWLIMYVDKLR